MNDESVVIGTQGLSKSFNGLQALQDLDLQVPRNSIFGFLGPNGAGKSTTIKLLLGLQQPTSGQGSVFGQDIVADSVAIRQHVGYLAQDPRFYEHMTARETLRFTARFFYSGPPAGIEGRVAETIELVGLSDKADRPIKGFSGGERQRLGIAQAQINYPDLLILDEPAAALDPMGRRDVLLVMERLRKHTTIFFSTHILDDVQRVSDMAAILNRGALVAQAPITELLGDGDQVVYSLQLRGDVTQVRPLLEQQPWIAAIHSNTDHETTTWDVTVTDPARAETEMLRLVLAHDVSIVAFGRKHHELEDVFMRLVEGGNADGQ